MPQPIWTSEGAEPLVLDVRGRRLTVSAQSIGASSGTGGFFSRYCRARHPMI
jgi:hypothetical protein